MDNPPNEPREPLEQRRRGGFRVAIRGLWWVVRTQPHAWIHAIASTAVLAAGVLLHVDAVAWALIVMAIAMVWAAEAFNTAIETLCDRIHPEVDAKIGLVKDVAAGAVLMAAIGAAAVGLLVFVPAVMRWLSPA